MGVTVACFHSDGILPSQMDRFIKTERGLARASAPSLRSRAGMFTRAVDLDVLIFFSSFQM